VQVSGDAEPVQLAVTAEPESTVNVTAPVGVGWVVYDTVAVKVVGVEPYEIVAESTVIVVVAGFPGPLRLTVCVVVEAGLSELSIIIRVPVLAR